MTMSIFKGASVERLVERREQVDREIARLTAFQSKIDRRIAHLKSRPMTGFVATLSDEQRQAIGAAPPTNGGESNG